MTLTSQYILLMLKSKRDIGKRSSSIVVAIAKRALLFFALFALSAALGFLVGRMMRPAAAKPQPVTQQRVYSRPFWTAHLNNSQH